MTPAEIRDSLDDSIRWIDTRHALYLGAETMGPVGVDPLSAVVLLREWEMAAVIGSPGADWIARAAESATELIAFPENHWLVGSAVPTWIGELITLFDLPNMLRLAEPSEGEIRTLDAEDIAGLQLEDPVLRRELDDAVREGSTIFASLDDGVPVAFCYDAAATETLWDIGIDTVERHRGKGHAYRCASAAIRYWLERGKSPRWASAESNVASRRLARKLGFRPVDAMVIFEPDTGD